MTTIETTDLASKRAAGLRELADFIEAHPEFADAIGQRFLVYCLDAAEFGARARALGGERRKGADDAYFGVSRFFGAIEVHVYTEREQVCEAKVVGTETVEVPDPDAPKVTVTRDVIEWECTSVLKAGTEDFLANPPARECKPVLS